MNDKQTISNHPSSSRANKLISKIILVALLGLVALVFTTSARKSPESFDDLEKQKLAQQAVVNLAQSVASYANSNRKLPAALNELVPDFAAQIPLDPYGREYSLVLNGADRAFVYYYGKDGVPKGYAERDVDIAAVVSREAGGFIVQP